MIALQVEGPDRLIPWVRWTARILAGAFLLFWGAFFLEHLVEWFAGAGPKPPVRVVLLQLAHFTLLAGFILAWRYELAGAIIIAAAAIVFFSQVAGDNFLMFTVPTVLPALLFAWTWWKSRP
jgi:predicted membrane-bound mannosyltransferase